MIKVLAAKKDDPVQVFVDDQLMSAYDLSLAIAVEGFSGMMPKRINYHSNERSYDWWEPIAILHTVNPLHLRQIMRSCLAAVDTLNMNVNIGYAGSLAVTSWTGSGKFTISMKPSPNGEMMGRVLAHELTHVAIVRSGEEEMLDAVQARFFQFLDDKFGTDSLPALRAHYTDAHLSKKGYLISTQQNKEINAELKDSFGQLNFLEKYMIMQRQETLPTAVGNKAFGMTFTNKIADELAAEMFKCCALLKP